MPVRKHLMSDLIATGLTMIPIKLNAEKKAVLLESVLEHMADGIMLVDHDGTFLLINQAARQITGISHASNDFTSWQETFGCFKADGITPYDSKDLPLARAMRGESTDSEEIILKNPNLVHPVCISVSGRPLPPDSGLPGAAVIVFKDVTEQKNVEQQLKRSNEGLQQFAYVAAHDLQEPLRTITSYLELLAERCAGKLDDKGEKYLSSAIRGGERMQTLISDLLTFCRINSPAKNFIKISAAEAHSQALEMLQGSIRESGAAVTSDSLPYVRGDHAQLVQLFQNLISNSLKYKSDEAPKIHLACERSGANWLFSLSDNGIGIEPKYSERIFLIFQRLHGRNEYAGTGIGLAVCKSIVERHGGRIWVTARESGGSIFWFTLPIVENESS